MKYTLIRSQRKSLSLSVEEDLSVIVRAPQKTPVSYIDSFVAAHENWIEKHRQSISLRADVPPLGAEEISSLRQSAKSYLPQRTAYWSELMGLSPSSVKITSAKTRWGSCSGKNSISYTYRLMLLPPALIDYVIVHELCHVVHKNHGSDFYALLEKYLPDQKARNSAIKEIEKTLPR